MQTAKDDDICAFDDVEHAVREAPEKCAPDLAMDHGEGQRIALHGLETPVESLQELVTKVVTSLPVPRERVTDVGFGGVSEA